MVLTIARNAQFAAILMALVLVLQPAVGTLAPRSLGRRLDNMHHIARREDVDNQCFQTKLGPDTTGKYEELCGEKSDPHHHCFTHWGEKLDNVEARPWLEPFDVQKDFHIKDDNLQDFTVGENKNIPAFTITYRGGNGPQLIYSDYDKEKGCAKFTLRRGSQEGMRIWLSDDDDSDPRDIDTKHYGETSKVLCGKWYHIKVFKD
ncbi:related to Mig1 - Mig1 protein, induced during biotrophic phase [Ustilago trichophora]|uniref:Related to Mig1 - Mig1 protein, induced during biotrophic phase n=1 Tax=Ustilago trichophora TaxID=86804 RepID=A0A5C3E7D4_9BASI|nr:related to Mig1 - Mig1 protein, induced during biotrophic phase [Ustilago trichophora]